MKRFMKGCAIAALAMCAIGMVLASLAASIRGGAAINSVLETVTGEKLHANIEYWWRWGIDKGGDLLNSVEDAGFTVGDKDVFDHGREIMEGDVEKYNLGNNVKDMEIEAGGCKLVTKASGDGNFYVEAKKAKKFQGYVEGKTLHIKTVTSSGKLDDIGSCEITLYIPEGFAFDGIEIEMGAGVLETGGLNAKKVSLNVGAGQITVQGITASKAEISVGVGHVGLYAMKIGELSADVGMGGMTADGSVEKEAEIECAMGSVEMELSGKQSDFNYELSGAMGNLDLGQDSYSGFANTRRIDNGAAKDMDVECSMGNVSICFTE